MWYFVRHKFWEIVHNCIAHPLLPFGEWAWTFHDWTVRVWDPPFEPVKDTEILMLNRLLSSQEGRNRVEKLLQEANLQALSEGR